MIAPARALRSYHTQGLAPLLHTSAACHRAGLEGVFSAVCTRCVRESEAAMRARQGKDKARPMRQPKNSSTHTAYTIGQRHRACGSGQSVRFGKHKQGQANAPHKLVVSCALSARTGRQLNVSRREEKTEEAEGWSWVVSND